MEQTCRISGTKAALIVDDFVLPCDNKSPGFTIDRLESVEDGCESSKHEFEMPGENESQKTLLFRNFGELVLGGECDPYWPGISLLTQRVMDALMASLDQGGVFVELK